MSMHSGEDGAARMHAAHVEIPGPIIGGIVKYSCIQDLPDAVLHSMTMSVIDDPQGTAQSTEHFLLFC